jgi:rfaE bifunctional protein nucleotidyltransferase chain/domain
MFVESFRQYEMTIALSHGVFDLIHPGHIRHLKAAKSHANILIVSVTADKYVNKGPGQPAHPEMLRAEHLEALGCVDAVIINNAPTAVDLIDIIKPHFYVKGSDYANDKDDITGKIIDERQAVERHGGKLIFTNDIVFSSSGLMNKYMNLHDPKLKTILDRYRSENALAEMLELIDSIKDYTVTLIGDTIVDEYWRGETIGQAAKENILVFGYENKEVFAGGVIAAANHIASFVKEVEIITVLGTDGYLDFIQDSLAPNIKLNYVLNEGGTTIRKLRCVDKSPVRKVSEVFFDNIKPFDEDIEDALSVRLKQAVSNNVITITDFGHGVINDYVLDLLKDIEHDYDFIKYKPLVAATAQTNAANRGFNHITKYRTLIDYACLDAHEAQYALQNRHDSLGTLAAKLYKTTECSNIIITNGKNGCVAYKHDGWLGASGYVDVSKDYILPAFTGNVIDTMGAGDAFLAITAPLVKAGGKIDHVAFIGNAVGAIKVGIVGHREPVTKVRLLKFLKSVLQ